MSEGRDPARLVRTKLDHSTHYAARFGATFFITICCERRVANQLCRKVVAQVLFETARRYDAAQKWYLKVLLLMPDHLHMLVGIPGDANLSNLVRDFKRIAAKVAGIQWQRNSFDHRLRHDESEAEKFEYIRQNPVRAGLAAVAHEWPYVFCRRNGSRFSWDGRLRSIAPTWRHALLILGNGNRRGF
jgi:REP element-mobilizing transposase RayT